MRGEQSQCLGVALLDDPLDLGIDELGGRLRVRLVGATIEQAITATRAGGEVVLVGVPRMDVMVNLNAAFTWLYLAKTIKGCWYGSSDVHRDVPKLLELWKSGELKLEELISKEITVDDVNTAFADMQAGTVARSVIRHEH